MRSFKFLKSEQYGFGKPGIIIFLLFIVSLIAAAYCFIQANSKANRNRQLMDTASELKAVASQLVLDSVASIEGGQQQKLNSGDRWLDALIKGNGSDDSLLPELLNPEKESVKDAWSNFVAVLRSNEEQQRTVSLLTQESFGTLQSLSTSLQDWLNKIEVNQSYTKAVDRINMSLGVLIGQSNKNGEKEVKTISPQMITAWTEVTNSIQELAAITDSDAQILIGEMDRESELLHTYFKVKREDFQSISVNFANLTDKNHELQVVIDKIRSAVKVLEHEQHYLFRLGVVAALLSLMFLFVLTIVFWRNSQVEIELSNRSNTANQRAILRLLDEITALAEGDLTARATVTEDITGAIADSVNFAIETITELVETISKTSSEVKLSVAKTGSVAKKLGRASNLQNREVKRSSNYITAMANVMRQLSQSANKARDVADQAMMRATAGQTAVNETIESTQEIRSLIQATSKRLKRLGESSQQIGEIIRLVNDIAERTNLLALNASIQASASSGKNRIATVSDEVQILSEQVDQATRDIAALIDTIQADTRAAIVSMETSTEGVVRVSALAEQAGVELGEIQLVSESLSEKTQSIAERSLRQAEVSLKLSGNMKVISDIAKQTNDGMRVTMESISSLQSMSHDLTVVVGRFTLPDADESTSLSKED